MNNKDKFRFIDLVIATVRMLSHIPFFIWYRFKLTSIKPSDKQSSGKLLETKASQQPEHPFIFFEDQAWTYQAFNKWVNQIARVFKAEGVSSGDCVALMFENKPEQIACVMAANKLGAIAGMINFHQRESVLTHSFNLLKPRLVVLGEETVEHFERIRQSLTSDVTCFCYGESKVGHYKNLEQAYLEQPVHNLPETREITLQQACFYIFTSGTTGLPKAAKMSHLRWFKAGIGMGQASMGLNSRDILYCPLPLYHNNALTVALASVVQAGGALVICKKFSASRFWRDIRKYGVTSFIYIGELCRYLLQVPPSSDDQKHNVRVIVGNGLRPTIWDEFQSRFRIKRICEFYGASEANLAFVNVFNLKRTAGFCPLTYAVVRYDAKQEQPYRGVDGYLQRVAVGDVGLLITEISDKSPLDGYSDKAATEAKTLQNVFQAGDRWFNTGDLVRDQGFYHIAFIDRLGDTFRWKGENIATTEVEGVAQGFPSVKEAVVYGVEIPHSEGRAGMVAITLEPNCTLDLTNFLSHIKRQLPEYEIPLFIRVQEATEITETFKLKKVTLKKEGYDINTLTDPVYILDGSSYVPLTHELYDRIQQGIMRF